MAPTGLRFTGGLFLIASLGGAWTGDGIGSTLSALEFADLLLSGAVEALVPRWAGLAFYLLALAGAVSICSLGLAGRTEWWTGHGALLVGLMAFGALAFALDLRPMATAGAGARTAGIGLALLVGGSTLDAVSRRATHVEARPDVVPDGATRVDN